MGHTRPDDQTRKVSWDMVRRSARAGAGERSLQVSTKCRSVDELLTRFAPFATDDSLTVPARPGIAVGDRLVLRVALADNTEVFTARGEVAEVKNATDGSADTRPVVRVRLLEMDEDNQALFLSLSGRGAKRAALGAPADNERTVVPWGGEDTMEDKGQPTAQPAAARPPEKRPLPSARPPIPEPPRAAFAPAKGPATGSLPPPSFRHTVPTRRPPAPTVIPPAPDRSTVPTAPPPPPAEPEQRTPGSVYKLPANPLAELNADAVLSFVDCNVYEATEDPPPTEEVTRVAPSPSARPEERHADDRNPQIVSPPLRRDDELTAPPELQAPWRRKLQDAFAWVSKQIDKMPTPVRRTLVQAMPFAFCTLLGWCVGFNMAGLEPRLAKPTRGGSTGSIPQGVVGESVKVPPRSPTAAPTPPIPPKAQVQAAAAEPSKPSIVQLPTANPETPPPPPTPKTCLVRINVRPSEVLVTWNGQALGTTPLPETAVPCGPGRLLLQRERWETVSRSVIARPGKPVDLSVLMNRPPTKLAMTTTPPGATIEVNGQPIGKSPRKISWRRFETVKIDIRLAGHRSWHSEVLLRAANEKLDVRLDPLPKPKEPKL